MLAPAPQVIITRTGADGAAQSLTLPKTSAEVEALQTKKQELTEELANVSARRHELSEEIRSAPDGASRTGLEARLKLMDQRILQLETDIGTTSAQLSSTPAEVLAIAQSDNRPHERRWQLRGGVSRRHLSAALPVGHCNSVAALQTAPERWHCFEQRQSHD